MYFPVYRKVVEALWSLLRGEKKSFSDFKILDCFISFRQRGTISFRVWVCRSVSLCRFSCKAHIYKSTESNFTKSIVNDKLSDSPILFSKQSAWYLHAHPFGAYWFGCREFHINFNLLSVIRAATWKLAQHENAHLLFFCNTNYWKQFYTMFTEF